MPVVVRSARSSGGRVAEDELAAVAGGAAGARAGPQWRRSTHPAEELHRQIVRQASDARGVVADIEHNQDLPVALASLSGGDEPLHDLADLRGGHCRDNGPGLRSARASERIGEAVGH
ncbi:hypothetical protein AB0M48_41400 [Lentzea sp. NPDC051208]|uniref:hypothetical protein n=1 Tax=Lentzea sp. NPDC051208 TaxID=3154642 RepID=UPI0034276F9A